MQKTGAPVHLDSPSAQKTKTTILRTYRFRGLTPSLHAPLPHAQDLQESTTSLTGENQSLQVDRKRTLMVTHRERHCGSHQPTPEICMKMQPSVSRASSRHEHKVRNEKLQHQAKSKSDYVKDVLQPNGHIFKDKPYRPSASFLACHHFAKKNIQKHKDSKSEVTNFQLLPHISHSLKRQKVMK